ncbi:hypothetical protein AA313_de0210196 [Arthrobotrys entomopaga]|nr:hypothetical protein AA313_de0210196 [Arthrobotrys entomopaga]
MAEFTYTQVAEHDTKDSLYVVIDDKVYDVSKFVDEHPGGEEVLLDVAGTDGTEAFEVTICSTLLSLSLSTIPAFYQTTATWPFPVYVCLHDKLKVGRNFDAHRMEFADVGHSDEAREILAKYLLGDLKRGPNDPKPAAPSRSANSSSDDSSSGGLPGIVYAILVAGIAAGGYYYLQLQQQQGSA